MDDLLANSPGLQKQRERKRRIRHERAMIENRISGQRLRKHVDEQLKKIPPAYDSSAYWRREMRMHLSDLDGHLGSRTKQLFDLRSEVKEKVDEEGA